MFSIPSFSKLIVLVVIIAAVWYGFRFLGEVEKARRAAMRGPAAAPRRPGGAGRRDDSPRIEDTVKCRVCGAYVPARQPARCSRADCPF
jgi:hypothetical protein